MKVGSWKQRSENFERTFKTKNALSLTSVFSLGFPAETVQVKLPLETLIRFLFEEFGNYFLHE